jgi:hypothetical protein
MILATCTPNDTNDITSILNKATHTLPLRQDILNGEAFEDIVCSELNNISVNTAFARTFEKTPKLAFPDIVAKIQEKHWIGIEVKTSQKDWKCFGNSIFESTRINDVSDIYVFFAKFSKPLECKWGEYAQCIETINITHAPRYQINMELACQHKTPVFDTMGISYEQFRRLSISEQMHYVRHLKKSQLGRDAALWWLPDSLDIEASEKKLVITLFNELDKSKQHTLVGQGLILFPELFKKQSSTKYHRLIKWLAAEHGIVSHSIRDAFSSGGQYTLRIHGKTVQAPKIYKTLYLHKDVIMNYFNNTLPIQKDDWVSSLCRHAKDTKAIPIGFPLEEWLKDNILQ